MERDRDHIYAKQLWTNLRDTNSETYEATYAIHRTQLCGHASKCSVNLLYDVATDYAISTDRLTYVMGVMMACGFKLDDSEKNHEKKSPRDIIKQHRGYSDLLFGMSICIARTLATACNIRRLVVVPVDARDTVKKSLETLRSVVVTRETPMYDDLHDATRITSLLFNLACCDADLDIFMAHHHQLSVMRLPVDAYVSLGQLWTKDVLRQGVRERVDEKDGTVYRKKIY